MKRWKAGPKTLAFSAAGLVLSLGLCGAAAASGNSSFATFFVSADVIVLFASLLGFIVGVIWIVFGIGKPKS